MKKAFIDAGIIQYHEHGNGPAVVFLHGTLSNSNTWRKVVPLMSAHFHCIVPDLPLGAHAIPLHPAADLSPEGIAVLLKQFLDQLGIKQAIIIGNDTGGAYAQIFAMMYPASLSALVLCNSDALEIFPPKAFSLLQTGVNIPGFTWFMAQLFRCKPLLTTSLVLGLLSHSLDKEQLAELYIKQFIKQRGIRRDFIKVVKGWSASYTLQAAKALESFQAPVLVIWGADDEKLFPLALGRRLHAIFPNAVFQSIQHSLTYVQEDQPEAFARYTIEFIENIAAPIMHSSTARI